MPFDIDTAREFAIRAHPELRDFPELIDGESLDAVMASAAGLSQRLSTPQQQQRPTTAALAEQAKTLYGPQGGATGTPLAPQDQADAERVLKAVHDLRKMSGWRGEPRGATKAEFEKFAGEAGAALLLDLFSNGTGRSSGVAWSEDAAANIKTGRPVRGSV